MKKTPKTYYNEMSSIVVKAWRALAKENGTAPTDKTSDEKILEIYSKVLTAFRNASNKRGEFISDNILNLIAYHFFVLFEKSGESFMNEHLDYEIDLYIN